MDALCTIATGNAAKLAQLIAVRDAFNLDIEIVSARAVYGDHARYNETGETTAEIARAGALEVARRVGVPILAEDTALYVDALGGQPGIRAGAFLKDHGRAGLLGLLDGVSNRNAIIISTAAWATPEGAVQTWMTTLEGEIADDEIYRPGLPGWAAPTRDNPAGGGYNAVFMPAGLDRPLAALSLETIIGLGYREPGFSAALLFIKGISGL